MLTFLDLKMIWMTHHFGPAQEGDEKRLVQTCRVEIQDEGGSFRFRFPGTGYLALRFVGAYSTARFAEMIGSFRFASFPFHRRFLTSVSLLDEEFTLCWRACGSGGLERIVG
jgi:hypothetical protein